MWIWLLVEVSCDIVVFFFFSSRRRHTRLQGDWSSDVCSSDLLWGQGVTTAAMSGVVAAQDGTPLADATIVAVHVPSGTQYRAVTRAGGAYNVQIGRAAWRGRVEISVVAGSLKKKKKDD